MYYVVDTRYSFVDEVSGVYWRYRAPPKVYTLLCELVPTLYNETYVLGSVFFAGEIRTL